MSEQSFFAVFRVGQRHKLSMHHEQNLQVAQFKTPHLCVFLILIFIYIITMAKYLRHTYLRKRCSLGNGVYLTPAMSFIPSIQQTNILTYLNTPLLSVIHKNVFFPLLSIPKKNLARSSCLGRLWCWCWFCWGFPAIEEKENPFT